MIIKPLDKEMIARLADGETIKEMSDTMKMSLFTVRTYKWRLMKKLGVNTTAHLVSFAFRNHIIQ